MSGYGECTIDGLPFRLNPEEVMWSYSIRAADQKTVGGKVIQILGVRISDLVIRGSFGVGGWDEQQRLLDQVKKWGDAQVSHPTPPPMRFLWPERKWDFLVFVKSMKAPGDTASIRLSNEVINPQYELTLFVVNDNTGLRQVQDSTVSAYISRLAAGIGWKQTKYNGPMDETAFNSATGGVGIDSYILRKLGITDAAAVAAAAKKAAVPAQPTPRTNADIRAQLKIGFALVDRPDMAAIVDGADFDTWVNQESGWNPWLWSIANNEGKPNYGLFQFWAGHGFMSDVYAKWDASRPGEQQETPNGISVPMQAQLVVTNFVLTPERVTGFANEIRAKTYVGWG